MGLPTFDMSARWYRVRADMTFCAFLRLIDPDRYGLDALRHASANIDLDGRI
jgi:hypothetical protein